MTEEYLDLVDENDQVIGREARSKVHEQGLLNFRCINAFVVNSEGKLWIPRRTAHKRLKPLALDISVGGHVESGSTYEETLIKEVSEELNIDLTKVPYREIGYFKGGEYDLRCFQKVYEIRQDEVPQYNPDDFMEYYWLTPQELMDKIEAGDVAKHDLPILIRQLYLK
jgi:isopentenyldiphosphate isomerase